MPAEHPIAPRPNRKPYPAGGRPSKISPRLIDQIATALEGGAYLEVACAMYGICRQTKLNWIKRGQVERERLETEEEGKPAPEERLYLRFLDIVEIACARADVRDLAIVDKAAQGGSELGRVVETQRVVPVLDDKGNPVLIRDASGSPMFDANGKPLVATVTEVSTTREVSVAAPTWQAAAWKLERRSPSLYGRRVLDINAALSNPDGSPLATAAPVLFYLPDNGRGDAIGAAPAPSDDPLTSTPAADAGGEAIT